MKAQLLNKTFSFEEAKKVLRELVYNFGTHYKESSAEIPVKRFELRIEKLDPLLWLAQQNFPTKIYGEDQDANYAIAGVGEAQAIKGTTNAINLKKLFTQMHSVLRPEYPYLRYYGGMMFDPGGKDNEWKHFDTYKFIIPRFELAAKEGKMLFACNIVGKLDNADSLTPIIEELDNLQYRPQDIVVPALETKTREDIPSEKVWQAHIENILRQIKQNKFQKIVLARKTKFDFPHPLNPWLILRQLKKVTPYSYHFCFQYEPGLVFLGASPERLYRRRGKTIETEAVAGTRRRGKSHKEDDQLREELLHSNKDAREHEIVVKGIESVLSEISTQFKKENLNILSLQNGHHLVTAFTGELKEGVADWQILEKLHPTPAVGGWPKAAALEVLRQLEPFSRGWYAGPVGYVGLNETEFVVAIRSALVKNNELTVYAGAGIVEGSDPKAEWDEVENKIGNFLKVLNY